MNSNRQIVKLIKEICEEKDIDLRFYAYDWIMQLSSGEKSIFIYGYQFQENNAAADLICCDKGALSEILIKNNIPAVPHSFFMAPSDLHYIGGEGNWNDIISLLDTYGKVVCKKNNGTGGIDVYKVTNQSELENAVSKIFASGSALAVAPFCEIEAEYRIIVLNGRAEIVYLKEILFVAGDGIQTVEELCLHKYGSVKVIMDLSVCRSKVLAEGEKVCLNWKHNLAQGAVAQVIEEEHLLAELTTLALKAVNCLGIGFASVDIVRVNGEFKILEINSGIVMEKFSRQSREHYKIAKRIYEAAVESCFLTKF